MAPPKPNPNVRSKFSLLQRCLLPTRYQAWLAKDQLLETNPDGMRSGNARQLGKVVMIRNNSAMNAVRHLGPDRIAMPPFKRATARSEPRNTLSSAPRITTILRGSSSSSRCIRSSKPASHARTGLQASVFLILDDDGGALPV